MKTWIIDTLRKFYMRHCNVINRFPFLNKIVSHGKLNRLELDKPLINSNIIISGSGNLVKLLPGGICKNLYISIEGNDNIILISTDSSIIDGVLCIEDSKNRITIGNGTKICGSTELACIEGTQIIIGDNCLFSSGIKARTGDSHSVLDLNGVRINESQDIIFGNRVWVCNDVKVLKGAKIADDSIIGAASVVTRQFSEKNVVIAGNPAHIIKQNIKWSTLRV